MHNVRASTALALDAQPLRSTRLLTGKSHYFSRHYRVTGLAITLLLAALLLPPQASGQDQAPQVSVKARLSSILSDGAHHTVVDGVRLWYRVAGKKSDAAPVVFLHGGPGANSQRFASLIGPRLEQDLRMVYLDQRGSGRSERPWTGEYSIDRLVDDLEGLRRHLGVNRISLIGHSFGTILALEYAAKHSEHVDRMVLAAAVGDLTEAVQGMCERLAEVNPEAYERATAGGDCDVFSAISSEEREEFFQSNMFPDSTTRIRIDSVDAEYGLRNTGELSSALFKNDLLEYKFKGHDELTMPVLVIAGRRDYQAGIKPQRKLAETLPKGRFEVFESSGHFMYVDEAQRFADVVTSFLGD